MCCIQIVRASAACHFYQLLAGFCPTSLSRNPNFRMRDTTMLSRDEDRLRDLCQQAMTENDVHRLLMIFLALDSAARVATAEVSSRVDPRTGEGRAAKNKQDKSELFQAEAAPDSAGPVKKGRINCNSFQS